VWYEAVLTEQESSGLSVASAADRVGVTPATLYQWRRRLPSQTGESASDPAGSHGLIELSVSRQALPTDAKKFVVHTGRGRSIEIPSNFGENDLRRLLSVLEEC